LTHVNIADAKAGYRDAMPDPFILRPLTRRQVAQAYALVRHALPHATPARWDSFARARIGADGLRRNQGIITLQSQAGYILGLFIYDLRDDLQDGRTLSVSHVAVAELVGQATLAQHLVDGMVTVARLHDCATIEASLPQHGRGDLLRDQFRGAGFDVDGRHARHRLAGAAPLAACASGG
jgi:hypothetical protein